MTPAAQAGASANGSATNLARLPGSRKAATRSARGRPATSAYAGWNLNGWRLAVRPNNKPTPRPHTCARNCSPCAWQVSNHCNSGRQPSGLCSACASENDSGRPLRRATSSSKRCSASGEAKSDTSWNTPAPAAAKPSASPSNSSLAASSVGVGRPSLVRWLSVREVETPSAPARSASVTKALMAATSSGVAASRLAPRSPITKTRSAACGTCVATSTSNWRASSRSRYSGKLSQFQGRPSARTAFGMSSTPSMRRTNRSRSAARHGAKPTPQLPITTVVTPWAEEGASCDVHIAWPS